MVACSSSFDYHFDVQQIVTRFDQNVADIERWAEPSGNNDETISTLKEKVFKRIKDLITYMDSLDKHIEAKTEFHHKMVSIKD